LAARLRREKRAKQRVPGIFGPRKMKKVPEE